MLGGRAEGGNSNVYMGIRHWHGIRSRGPLPPVQNTGADTDGPAKPKSALAPNHEHERGLVDAAGVLVAFRARERR